MLSDGGCEVELQDSSIKESSVCYTSKYIYADTYIHILVCKYIFTLNTIV